jgi:hypothetical protein
VKACAVLAVTTPLVICGPPGGGAGSTVITSVLESPPPEVDAVTVTLVVPACEGVPLIIPRLLWRESPAGKGLAVKLVGEFVAAIW